MGMAPSQVFLPRQENQTLGIAQFAIDFLGDGFASPDPAVLRKVEQFHLDSIACAVAAIGCGTNAPCVLREEAMEYAVVGIPVTGLPAPGASLFGSTMLVKPEKAVLANCAAVRELDANGTNFGFNAATGDTRGEFGHNDFYPVVLAAAQQTGADGRRTLLGMLCLDEIRGRLAEVFALKDHKIDHVVHGAIASAAVYGAMLGASAAQIESAIGLVLAHYIPFRAIRAGHQLSDSKGASAAISAEMAVVSVQRARRGFVGPADVFRNPQAVFCLFEPPENTNESPFDLALSTSGCDFAVMGMHFKLGLYEHQSAGAIQGLIDVLGADPGLLDSVDQLERVRITIYEPAFSIIGDPAKRDPRTRQSADHSMVYIIATLLRKAVQTRQVGWRELMLVPDDYNDESLFDPITRQLMARIEFVHGGRPYDQQYPDGIPTTLEITHRQLGTCSSGLVMYPAGHARNRGADLDGLLDAKCRRLADYGVCDAGALIERFSDFETKTSTHIRQLYDFQLDAH
jgi:2-methylcitrate dehydratase